MKEKHILTINRSELFDPVAFIGPRWKIEKQDGRALLVAEIDFGTVFFENCFKEGDELFITGEEKLKRHLVAGHICPDAKIAQTIYEEEGQKILEYIYKEKGISWFELMGTTLCSSLDFLYSLCFYRFDGSWHWHHYSLGINRSARAPSLVLSSS